MKYIVRNISSKLSRNFASRSHIRRLLKDKGGNANDGRVTYNSLSLARKLVDESASVRVITRGKLSTDTAVALIVCPSVRLSVHFTFLRPVNERGMREKGRFVAERSLQARSSSCSHDKDEDAGGSLPAATKDRGGGWR